MAKQLAGQTFVVTGTLEGYSRTEAKSAIEARPLSSLAPLLTTGQFLV